MHNIKSIIFLLIFLTSCDTAKRLQKKCERKAKYALAAGCLKRDSAQIINTHKLDTVVQFELDTVIKDSIIYVDCPEKGAKVPVTTPIKTIKYKNDIDSGIIKDGNVTFNYWSNHLTGLTTIKVSAVDTTICPEIKTHFDPPPQCRWKWWHVVMAVIIGAAVGIFAAAFRFIWKNNL